MKRRLLSLLALTAMLVGFFLTTNSIKGTSHLLCVPGASNI